MANVNGLAGIMNPIGQSLMNIAPGKTAGLTPAGLNGASSLTDAAFLSGEANGAEAMSSSVLSMIGDMVGARGPVLPAASAAPSPAADPSPGGGPPACGDAAVPGGAAPFGEQGPLAALVQLLLGELAPLLTGLLSNGTPNGFGGGAAPDGNGAGDITMGSGTPNSGGAGAAQLAGSMLGKAAGSLSFQNYSHAGGVTNDCADFVSGIIADTEGFHKTAGDASVQTFQADLQQQGWRQVSKSQTQPGDVAIIGGNQHNELCTQAGGRQFIGANGDATETIGTDDLNWANGSATYWHKPG